MSPKNATERTICEDTMKELVVVSGKGGKGKTSIVASFAALAMNAVLADCDMDAADLHLLLDPGIKQTHDFSGGKLAAERNNDLIIVDGSPGIGCPVIASITGADLVVAITEPTLSGRHDLDRVVELKRHFKIPTVICVNKCDVNLEITEEIREAAQKWNFRTVGDVPYDPAVTRAQVAGKSIIEYSNGSLRGCLMALWQSVLEILEENEKAGAK